MSEDQIASLYFIALFVIVTPLIIIHFRRVYKKILRSMNIVRKVLNSNIERKDLGLTFVIEGIYKFQKIEVLFSFISFRRLTQRGQFIVASVYPKRMKKRAKLAYNRFYQPTELTQQMTNYRIDYHFNLHQEKPDSDGLVSIDKATTEGEVVTIFDELVKAAEIAEAGQPYYKE